MAKRKRPEEEARKLQLAEWLRLGLQKPGKKGIALAQILNEHVPTISKMARGQRAIKETELEAISKYIEEPVPLMVGGGDADDDGEELAEALVWASPSVFIAPFVWREEGVETQGPELVPLSMDRRIKDIKQYVAKITGDGSYAICIPFGEWRPKPIDGDVVHVRRFNGRTYEDTLRTVVVQNNLVRLVLDGHPDCDLYFPPSENEYEVRGTCDWSLAGIQVLTKPSVCTPHNCSAAFLHRSGVMLPIMQRLQILD